MEPILEPTAVFFCLPASHKNVLFADEHDGYAYDEVAVRLGFTKQTVKKYLTQAKAQLRVMSCGQAAIPRSAHLLADKLRL